MTVTKNEVAKLPVIHSGAMKQKNDEFMKREREHKAVV